MPNWCSNKLTVSGPDEDVRSFVTKAVGHSPWSETPEKVEAAQSAQALNFHSLVPIPDDVLAAGYEVAGYQWELANWGSKWGACESAIVSDWDGTVGYAFDTAWSPPLQFLERVAKHWPSLTFILEYEEGGEGFKGLAKFQGEAHEDHCISL
jgi:hypothetical protein